MSCMKSKITMTMRRFPVLAHDHRTGREEAITVTLEKSQLRAAQIVGMSSTELIERLCEKQGYSVTEIGTPDKRTITLDLNALLERYDLEQDEKKSGIICMELTKGPLAWPEEVDSTWRINPKRLPAT